MSQASGSEHSTRNRRRRPRTKVRIPKTTILFAVGLLLVIYEAVLRGDSKPRIELLMVYLFMMGFPVAEVADLLRRRLLEETSWSETDEQQ